MRVCLVLFCIAGAFAADLRNEDLASVRTAFQTTDPSLSQFWATDKKPIDSNRAVMIVAAGRARERPGTVGVFIVSGTANRVRQTVDRFAPDETEIIPHIGRADGE